MRATDALSMTPLSRMRQTLDELRAFEVEWRAQEFVSFRFRIQ
jgi:hypothetical protein